MQNNSTKSKVSYTYATCPITGNLMVWARQRIPTKTSLHSQMSFVLKPRTAVPLGTNR